MNGSMKSLAFLVICLFVTVFSYAGDAAVLVDKGFSSDGNYYIFAQYGKTDKKFQGWAQIFTVDVSKNEYVDGAVFMTKPSSATFEKTGKQVYEQLESRVYVDIKKYDCNPAKPDQILYIREDEKKTGTDEIIFKDFTSSLSEDQAYYSVNLVPTYNGSGEKSKSSFYINLEKRDFTGKVLATQKIGTPNLKRNGVTNYKIERIVCDKEGKNIVFIVEKHIEDKTGVNIRYMIEAATLSTDFFENLAESPLEENLAESSENPAEEQSSTEQLVAPQLVELDAESINLLDVDSTRDAK